MNHPHICIYSPVPLCIFKIKQSVQAMRKCVVRADQTIDNVEHDQVCGSIEEHGWWD